MDEIHDLSSYSLWHCSDWPDHLQLTDCSRSCSVSAVAGADYSDWRYCSETEVVVVVVAVVVVGHMQRPLLQLLRHQENP